MKGLFPAWILIFSRVRGDAVDPFSFLRVASSASATSFLTHFWLGDKGKVNFSCISSDAAVHAAAVLRPRLFGPRSRSQPRQSGEKLSVIVAIRHLLHSFCWKQNNRSPEPGFSPGPRTFPSQFSASTILKRCFFSCLFLFVLSRRIMTCHTQSLFAAGLGFSS